MNIAERIRRKIKLYKGEHLMLARVACLGHDVRDILYKDKHLVNQQKARADLFLEWMNGRNLPVANSILPHLNRKDIFNLMLEQEQLPWLEAKRSYGLILMDSFAELTDQKFVHKKDGWSFACNYTDLNHSDEFKEDFECHGLIDIQDIEPLYHSFFRFINKNYPHKEIVFMHFPTILDQRVKFRERGAAIKDAIKEVSKVYKNVRSISVEDDLVLPHQDDDFPYHYGKETYTQFAKKILGV